MKRVISLLLALFVVTANGCIGFASAEGTLTVTETQTDGEYTVCYDVPQNYQVVIPASGTTSSDKSKATMVVSGSASLASNEILKVYIKKPEGGAFVMQGNNGKSVNYTITSDCPYNVNIQEAAVSVGCIIGGVQNSFLTNLTFAVTNPNSAEVGKYSQNITFVSTVVTEQS